MTRSRSSVLVATLLVAAAASVAHANPEQARALYKQGIEEYRQQKYQEAAETLQESYKLDPKPDSLFAWAQAERLAGHCDKAIPLYRQLTDQSSDLGTARLVHDNLARCEQASPPPPKPEPEKPEDKPAPVVAPPTERIVVREVRHVDKLATALLVGGSLGVGAGTGLFIASVGSADAADTAGTYDAHIEAADRAKLQRTLAYVIGGAGVAMLGVGVWRVMSGGGESEPQTTVTIVPTGDGGAIGLSRRW